MILIISHPDDVHAQAVGAALDAIGAKWRVLDLSLFPTKARLRIDCSTRGERFVLDWPGGAIDLDEVGAVWWRRPQPFTLDDSIADPHQRQFAYGECQEAIEGLWQASPASWINPPDRDLVAHRKVLQLAEARRLGLKVPRTLITNDPAAVEPFIESLAPGKTIYKAFSGTERAWRETRLFSTAEMEHIGEVALAPVIFQEYIAAQDDLRITIVGDRVFACAIDATATAYPVDFRMHVEETKMQAICLPAAVEQRLLALMHRLEIVYGAVDMRRTPNGEYFFLEVNPAGQWLFVEQRTRQPIAAALAEALAIRDFAMRSNRRITRRSPPAFAPARRAGGG